MITLGLSADRPRYVLAPVGNPVRHVPLTHEAVLRAREHIPPALWSEAWIAGSAATRYPQNKDVDIWVCGVKLDPRKSLDDVLYGGKKFKDEPDDVPREYDHLAWRSIDANGLQIMVTHNVIETVLDGFDISCHAAAVNLVSGQMMFSPGYDERLRVLNLARAAASGKRYLRFAQRYDDFSAVDDPMTQAALAAVFGVGASNDGASS